MEVATVSTGSLYKVLDNFPDYSRYTTSDQSIESEHRLRTSQAETLRDITNRLLTWCLINEHRVDNQKQEIIEVLLDELSNNIKLLNRHGNVAINGNRMNTIPELEELDSQIVVLLEHMTCCVRRLGGNTPTIFAVFAQDMSVFLDSCNELLEERNRLLGLGWESEIRRGLYCGI